MPRGGPVFRQDEGSAFRRQPKSLTASARAYESGPGLTKLRKTGRRTRSREWQAVLWDLYDIVGEFRYGCDWVGSLLSRAKLYVAGPDGQRTQLQAALDAMATLFDGDEGQEEMLRLLGVNFTVAGEAFIISEPGKGKDGYDSWRVAASCEVSEQSGRYVVEGEALDKQTLGIRLWKAHPRISTESNSPARAALPILNQMVKLSQVVDSQADSRLTGNGLLLIPSELELPAVPGFISDDDEQGQMVPTDAAPGLTYRLIKTAQMAMEDRDSAAASLPVVVAAPGEFLGDAKHIEFWSGFDEHAKELREEAIRRLAIAMDMPPEILTGSGEVNHWGSWQIEEAAIKAHTEPLLGIIVSSLTTGYLRPFLETYGVPNPEDYSIEADTSALRLRPNLSKEALELFDRGELKAETLLVETGFDPATDAPDEIERQRWLVQKIASGSTTPDQVAAAAALLGVTGIPGTVEEQQITTEARPTRSLEEHPTREIPTEENSEAEGVQASAAFVVDGVVLAAEQMVFRALERAGNRLKTKVGRNIGGNAMDLYLSCPQLTLTEAEDLLTDAWTTIDRTSIPGVSTEALREALNTHTLSLLRMQKPYSREALSRHLLLGLADEA